LTPHRFESPAKELDASSVYSKASKSVKSLKSKFDRSEAVDHKKKEIIRLVNEKVKNDALQREDPLPRKIKQKQPDDVLSVSSKSVMSRTTSNFKTMYKSLETPLTNREIV